MYKYTFSSSGVQCTCTIIFHVCACVYVYHCVGGPPPPPPPPPPMGGVKKPPTPSTQTPSPAPAKKSEPPPPSSGGGLMGFDPSKIVLKKTGIVLFLENPHKKIPFLCTVNILLVQMYMYIRVGLSFKF